MTRTKDDRYYAERLLIETDKFLAFASRADFSDPERNEEAIYAMNFCIIRIREIMANLSEDFQRRRLKIRAGQFADFRNLLVHDYGNMDYSAYKDLAEKDIRKMKANLQTYLGN